MKQVITSILSTILMSMVGTNVYAYDIEVKNADGVTIYYNYINDGKELEVTNKSYSGSVIIPEDVIYMDRTRKVTSIGDKAFYSCYSLTSVTIPQSVTNIGERAFCNCYNLTSVTIPNSVTFIDDYAFADCPHLTSLDIPNSVTSTGIYAFQNCSGLTSIKIPETLTVISLCAFADCSGLSSITIPDNVTHIEYGAFANCSNLTSITIPHNVIIIDGKAFAGCNLSVVISRIENPFTIETNTFSDNTFYNATLYVPEGTIDKYKTTEGWKKFAFIEEGIPSNIININNDALKEKKRYTLNGRIITLPQKGINIIQMNNGKNKKVLVR